MTSKIGRNDPCPCGSGKKYKKCCMAADVTEIRTLQPANIPQEVRHIIDCAYYRDARLVRLGSLLLFSTETGDAWLLDVEDNHALCLLRDSEAQLYVIDETTDNYIIAWDASYQIRGDAFVVYKKSGEIRTIIGYPTKEIARLSGK